MLPPQLLRYFLDYDGYQSAMKLKKRQKLSELYELQQKTVLIAMFAVPRTLLFLYL